MSPTCHAAQSFLSRNVWVYGMDTPNHLDGIIVANENTDGTATSFSMLDFFSAAKTFSLISFSPLPIVYLLLVSQ